MIYLWHLFIKFSLSYSITALICDITIGAMFVLYMIFFLHDKREENKRDKE